MYDAFTAALLAALDESGAEGMSLPRLGKKLGLGASVVLRRLHLLSAAHIGGQGGPGWVRVESHDGRWMAWLTEAGQQALASAKDDTEGNPHAAD